MDVSDQIRKSHLIYGGSDNTNARAIASGKTFSYFTGQSINNADPIGLTKVPFVIRMQDEVGLFGMENRFIKVTLRLRDGGAGQDDINVGYYKDAIIDYSAFPVVNDYDPVKLDPSNTFPDINDYTQALITVPDLKSSFSRPLASIVLNNKGVGNKYIDSWVDCVLYTRSKRQWPYDAMFVDLDTEFYICIHARNTRRLPYDIECEVGFYIEDIAKLDEEQQKLIVPKHY